MALLLPRTGRGQRYPEITRQTKDRGSCFNAHSTSSIPPELPPDPNAQRNHGILLKESQRSNRLAVYPSPRNISEKLQKGFTFNAWSLQPGWARRQTYCLRRWMRKVFKRGTKPPESNDFTKVIRLELRDKHNASASHYVQAYLDTGSSINILSSSLVDMFDLDPKDIGEEVTLKTIGNGYWCSNRNIKGRLLFDDKDPSWIDAEFAVSKYEEHYDVLIGKETIIKHDLMKVNKGVRCVFAGFRCEPQSYSRKEIEQSEKTQKRRQEENAALKAEARQKASAENKSTSSSSNPPSSSRG